MSAPDPFATTSHRVLPAGFSALFAASYDSQCNVCDCNLYVGELVGYCEDVLACEDCWHDELKLATRGRS